MGSRIVDLTDSLKCLIFGLIILNNAKSSRVILMDRKVDEPLA